MCLLRFKDVRNSAERRPLPRCKGALVGVQLRGVLALVSWKSLPDISGWETCDRGMRLAELVCTFLSGVQNVEWARGIVPRGDIAGTLGEGG